MLRVLVSRVSTLGFAIGVEGLGFQKSAPGSKLPAAFLYISEFSPDRHAERRLMV